MALSMCKILKKLQWRYSALTWGDLESLIIPRFRKQAEKIESFNLNGVVKEIRAGAKIVIMNKHSLIIKDGKLSTPVIQVIPTSPGKTIIDIMVSGITYSWLRENYKEAAVYFDRKDCWRIGGRDKRVY